MDMSLSKLQELAMDQEAWCATVHGVAKSRMWMSDWTEYFEESDIRFVDRLNARCEKKEASGVTPIFVWSN